MDPWKPGSESTVDDSVARVKSKCFFVPDLPPTSLDADANDPLSEALVEPVVQPNSIVALSVPLAAFEQATLQVQTTASAPNISCVAQILTLLLSTGPPGGNRQAITSAVRPATFHRNFCRIHVLIDHESRPSVESTPKPWLYIESPGSQSSANLTPSASALRRAAAAFQTDSHTYSQDSSPGTASKRPVILGAMGSSSRTAGVGIYSNPRSHPRSDSAQQTSSCSMSPLQLLLSYPRSILPYHIHPKSTL